MKVGPDRYGPLFRAVKAKRCFVLRLNAQHRCGLGMTGHTAHHVGYLDSEGLLPVCGLVHDIVEGHGCRGSRGFRRARALDRLTKRRLGMTLHELALSYVGGPRPDDLDF